MAKRKDFTQINASNIYSSTIAEATQETQEEPKTRKPRKEYTAQEALAFMEDMQTRGRKGAHLPRINIAFSPGMYEYVKVMSAASGLSITAFVNKILQEHRDAHEDMYKRALDFRKDLF